MLWSALSQLGSKIGEVINYMFGSTSAASQNGSAWTALGSIFRNASHGAKSTSAR